MTWLVLAAAVMLPWIAGIAFVLALPRRIALLDRAGGLAWTLGAGWFAGVLLLTLWMRALAQVGVPFGIAAVALPLLVAAVALALLARPREQPALREARAGALRTLRGDGLAGWQRIAWFTLCAWLALRALLLFSEVTLRPLFPWEGWTIWATKARVYYEMRTLVPFVNAEAWASAASGAWFDAAPDAPATVPLLAAWICTALGRYDDVLMNVPWWIAGVALALAIFGALREGGLAPLAALAGTWLAVSLPLLNAHVALAGYADIFLAGAVTLAALGLYRHAKSRAAGDVALALAFVAALPLVKSAGVVWVAAMLPGVAAALLPARGRKVAGILFGVAAILVVVLTRTTVPLGSSTLHLDFVPQWGTLAQRMLLLDNWHLLWYAAAVALVVGARAWRSSTLQPAVLIVAGGLAYAFVVFAFPIARAWFGEPASANRTLLVIAPLTAALVVLTARDWIARVGSVQAAAADPGTEVAVSATPLAGA
ncbi:MAG: hypothetical protein ABIR52_00520 [Casimicrobiaceae bacterium]